MLNYIIKSLFNIVATSFTKVYKAKRGVILSGAPKRKTIKFLCYNLLMEWEKATDIVLVASIAMLAIFFILGICQWITRKSLKKVDKQLLFAPIPLILMAIVYFVFDKFLILNTRPNGSGESSFPSTHVMVVATIFLMVCIALPKYIRSKVAIAMIDVAMLALLSVVCTGRIVSNMHWLSDVIGGLAFAAIFAEIYYLCIKKIKFKKEKK